MYRRYLLYMKFKAKLAAYVLSTDKKFGLSSYHVCFYINTVHNDTKHYRQAQWSKLSVYGNNAKLHWA